MSYKVSIWSDAISEAYYAKVYMNRAQAIKGMRKLAYERLEAWCKLNTQAARNVMNAIDRCDDILQPQESRSVTISNTGPKRAEMPFRASCG